MTGATTPVGRGIADTLKRRAAERALEFRGRWHTWGDLSGHGERVLALLDAAGIPADAPVGLVARTRPPHAGVILGLIAANRAISMIYGFQSPQAKAADITARRLRVLVADAEDWTDETIAAARAAGTLGISIATDTAALVPGIEAVGAGPFRAPPNEASLELLSSGTTGPPKLTLLPFSALSQSVQALNVGQHPPQPGRPTVTFWPLANIAVCGLITRAYLGEPTALLEKFEIGAWVDAVRRHRPTTASGPPPVVRSILAAKVPREDLSSLEYFFGGSAGLEPEAQEEFERTYGIKLLWGYGATEFGGTVATWTPALRREFEGKKRGSIGRPVPGAKARIVDNEGREVARGVTGFLEGSVDIMGGRWIRTTDLASMDEDGFLFLHGRGDGAIVRGGFKVLPERVVAALRKHPDVQDAAVVGIRDARLGEVPAAAIEPRPGTRPDVKSLEAQVRAELPAHHVPAKFLIVDELPRNSSMKIHLVVVKKLFEN